jgi:glycosyltransferase involved in cell wall biosynthesis
MEFEMRLVVELTGLQSQSRLRGIGRYVRGLVKGLATTSGDHEVWLAASANRSETLEAIRSNFVSLIPAERIVTYRALDNVYHGIPTHRWRRRASELVRGHFLASMGADATLFSSMIEGFNEDAVTSDGGPLCCDIVRAAIAYDLVPLMAPEKYIGTLATKAWYEDKLTALRSCDVLLAISASAGREFVDHLGVDISRIAVIMGAADEFVPGPEFTVGNTTALDTRLGISRPFFIYTASFESRKNFERLIDAFGRFTAQVDKSHQLVLVTSNLTPVMAAIRELVQTAGLAIEDVIITGSISDDELKQLYRRCTAVVYPSMHEGFGLPILEAMQLDAAVIGSNTSSMPEIIGLQEAMFDPLSTTQIADKMVRVVHDEAFRARLKQNAVTRRAMFSWEKSGELVWRALEQAFATRTSKLRQSARSERYHALIHALKALPDGDVPPNVDEWGQLANAIAENLDTVAAIPFGASDPCKRVWRIEGPFDSTYSLALINRETARALKARGEDVALHSTEGPGDYLPNQKYLERHHADILELWRSSGKAGAAGRPTVVSRNLYPPRVNDMTGTNNFLHHYAWEETRFPTQWVDQFNLHLDGITCLSSHVMKVLQDNGVVSPLCVSGCGVDHWQHVTPASEHSFGGRSFRFLHVSSCFPRKGVDVLLAAYGKAFRRTDDVTLLIKTFPNPHNEAESLLAAARAADPDYPDVVLMLNDLSDPELKALYQHCHVFVAPSRAEGYGLPLAEAMLSGIPVITTGWSGQLDFCNEETAWLLDYSFEPARTHFELFGSVWAEPDVGHLATRMREVYGTTAEERIQKVEAGRKLLLRDHTWNAVVGRLSDAVERWSKPHQRKLVKVGWVSTWNCRCGIATYSAHLIDRFPGNVTIFGATNESLVGEDDARVVRAWAKDTPLASLSELDAALDRANIDAVVIQFNYYFFEFAEFNKFLIHQKLKGRTVVVDLHATVDPPLDLPYAANKRLSMLSESFKACDRIMVHSHHDLNRLKAIGIVNNTLLFPHGIIDGPPSAFQVEGDGAPFVIGSYGFCLPQKGLLALVSAFGILAAEDTSLRLQMTNAEYPIGASRNLAVWLRNEIARLGLGQRVHFSTDFFSDEDALAHLRKCNLIVFPYEETGESASGAVRFAIASGRPVVTNNLPIFDDVASAVFRIDSHDPSRLAADLRPIIAQLRSGGVDVDKKSILAEKWRREHSFETLASRLAALLQSLHSQQIDACNLAAVGLGGVSRPT